MATKKSNDANEALVLAEAGQDKLNQTNAKSQAAKLITDFSEVEEQYLVAITEDYLKLEPNNTYNYVFTGMTSFNGDRGGQMEAVCLVDDEGKKYVNAGTVIVGACKKVKIMPCLIRIVTKNMEEGKKGRYLDLDVYVLPVTVKKD